MSALIVVALLVGLIGFGFLSNATSGVGIIAWACLFAILARIAQAAEQHKEIRAILDRRGNAAEHR